jgi:alkylation response protein AidB-like acyl-CoA dehydrogenase
MTTRSYGGAFLFEEAPSEPIMTPERLSAEARLMARTMEEFLRGEVLPCAARMEAGEPGLMADLLRRAGTLGLLGGAIPATYEGLELTKSALALLTERTGVYLSFAISLGVHSSVAALPLLMFGTPEQRRRYLPGLASGEILGAYALSEADSGSDALHARTRATPTPDGLGYRLAGAKMWTTNGGFADLFTVFAQVDGERFTAFLVPRDTPGLIVGREEHKLGLHGSSTRRLELQEAFVPHAQVLGEVGRGALPALYALNIGRFNIGVIALGAAKEALRLAAQYATQRRQFGQPIAQFGLVRQKLARMAAAIFLTESMIYRIAGAFDAAIEAGESSEEDPAAALRAASEEYAIECSLIKFYSTEVLCNVVDEALQIHGGFGYSEEFPVARLYRDVRVFRIFEGTNEINRLAAVDQLLRRIRKGRLSLGDTTTEAVDHAAGELRVTEPSPGETATVGAALNGVTGACRQIRQALRYVLDMAMTHWGVDMAAQWADHQEAAGALAEMMAALFAIESGVLRRQQIPPGKKAMAEIASLALQAACVDLCRSALAAGTDLLCACTPEPQRESRVTDLQRLLAPPLHNIAALHDALAAAVLERESYPW